MSKKSSDGRGGPEPVRAKPQRGTDVIEPVRGGLPVGWLAAHDDPLVANFSYFIALKRWTASDAAYLLLGIDPLQARPWEGPRKSSLRDAYQRILLLIENEDYAVLPFEPRGATVTYESADVIRWALGIRDALPVPVPDYWSTAALSAHSAQADRAALPEPRPTDANRPEAREAVKRSPRRNGATETLPGASTREIVAAFNVDSTWQQSLRGVKRRPWLKPALLPAQIPSKGRARSLWNPVQFGLIFAERTGKDRAAMKRTIEKHFPAWLDEWDAQAYSPGID